MAASAAIDLVHKAIRAGILGNIQWNDAAARRVRKDPQLDGLQPNGIRTMLRQYVLDGHRLEQRTELRPEYAQDHPFWFRAVIPVAGMTHGLFVEVILVDDDETEPFVEIVNVHPQRL